MDNGPSGGLLLGIALAWVGRAKPRLAIRRCPAARICCRRRLRWPKAELVRGAIVLGGGFRGFHDGAVAVPNRWLPGGVGFAVGGIGIVEWVPDRRGGGGRILRGGFDVTGAAGGEAGSKGQDQVARRAHGGSPLFRLHHAHDLCERRGYS